MAVIGKNLVQRPRFPEAATESGWYGLDTYGEEPIVAPATSYQDPDPTHMGTGYRAFLTGKTYNAPLFYPLGNIEPGDYYVWLRCRDGASSGTGEFGIVPCMDTGFGTVPIWSAMQFMPGEREKYFHPLPPAPSGFVNISATFTIPNMGGYQYKDTYGDTKSTPADHAQVQFALVLISSGTLNVMSVGGARIDEISQYDEPLTGYFDGSMPEAAGVSFTWDGEPFKSTTSADDGTIAPTVIAPPVATFSDEPPEYTLPDTTGAAWRVNNEPAEPGTYTVEPTESGVTVSVIPEPLDGYVFEPEAQLQEHTWTLAPEPDPDPDPDPEPDPGPVENWAWPEEPTPGGRLVARWLKWDTADELLQASFHYEVARAFVWGYTRGRGFDDQMEPAAPLQRVIVSGAARLAYNPENVSRWQVSSESEVLTVFNGFNLAEQAILNRYRKRWA